MTKRLLFISLLLAAFSASAQTFELTPAAMNSASSEYAGTLSKEGIIFVSNRKTEVLASFFDVNQHQTSSWFIYNTETKTTELFAEEIKSSFNDGPLCLNSTEDTLYFTGDLNPKLNATRRSPSSLLGIYRSVKVNNKWQEPEGMSFNDSNSNTAHPTLSNDGKTMIFASNRNGVEADLFLSRWENNSWSEPVNMGPEINSKGSDLYPHLDERGWLYFTSNRAGGQGGFDIYQCALNSDGSFAAPVAMDSPINTEFNDFAFRSSEKGERALMSSDRKNNTDNLYHVEYIYPEFEFCAEAKKPAFCYYIEETEIVVKDTLPLVYEWNFGDGTKAVGLSHKHCFPGYGSYDIYLDVYDSITLTSFAKVAETHLEIEEPDYPLFELPDTLTIGQEFSTTASLDHLSGFPIGNVFWKLPDGTRVKNKELKGAFSEPGSYEIQLGVLSPKQANGYRRTCSVKSIIVVDPNDSTEPLAQTRSGNELQTLNLRGIGAITNAAIEKEPIVYFVEIAQSEEKIALSDPFFERVNYPIIERYEDNDSSFHYSVGEVTEITALYKIYKELLNDGYDQAVVMDRKADDYEENFVRRGMYFPEEVKEEMNKEMNKLSDVQFASNSHTIDKESYTNLNTVVEVMLLNPEIELMIHAHTDDRGNDDYNLELSKQRAVSVLNYLVKKGVSEDRLTFVGHGNTQPIANNNSDEGRARNRRVQFEILFEIMHNR